MNIIGNLMELKDSEYKTFQKSLIPELNENQMIGVRVPKLRKLAKSMSKEEKEGFLDEITHPYYDLDMLHGILLSEMKDYNHCLEALNAFLPYVNNWAVCDIISPKVFRRNREQLIKEIQNWMDSEHIYTLRFAIKMLMSHYLEEDFLADYIQWPGRIKTEEYYLCMMQAWFYATALAKQWDSTIEYLKEEKLSVWVHNKTIQKARESARLDAKQKQILFSMKR